MYKKKTYVLLHALTVALLLLLRTNASIAASPKTDLAKKVLDLTGARTRVVWLKGSRDSGGKLMVFDTDEGTEREIPLETPKAYDPKLSPDGTRIVFNYEDSETSYIVNFDGTGLKKLFSGRFFYPMGIAKDPETGIEWVYIGDSMSKEAQAEISQKGLQASNDSSLRLYRHRLDDLSVKELVWDKAPFNRRLTVAADGAQVWGEFPWPNCSVATLPNGTLKIYASGCNANRAPDDSGMFFNLIGDHRNIRFSNKDGSARGGNVAINTMPSIENDPERKVWRPRWSNNIRFFSVQSGDTGRRAEIAIGRFDEKFSKVEAWVRLTSTDTYNADSTVWIKPVTPLGDKLTDNLDFPAFKAALSQLESAQQAKPIVAKFEQLSKNEANKAGAAAASEVLEHIERWAQRELSKAGEAESHDPHLAGKTYQQLAKRFSGMEAGNEAAARLRDPKLLNEAKAWNAYLKAEQAVKGFVDVPGAEPKATDKKWMSRNQLRVSQIKSVANALKNSASDTIAWSKVQDIMQEYEIK